MSRKSPSNTDFPTIQNNIDLSSLNTLGVHAQASIFMEITNKEQLHSLYDQDFFKIYRPFILGGGSNILLKKNPDRTVVKVSLKGIEKKHETDTNVVVTVAAGEIWHDVVTWAVEQKFGGIENLALIPGTVGAAPIQNIGAYGVELSEVFESLTAFHINEGEFKLYSKEDCQFGYRDSVFKHALKGYVIITEVSFRLTRNQHRLEASYYALQEYFNEKGIVNPGIKEIYDAVISIRKSKLPDPELIGNAGSFFKNPIVDINVLKTLEMSYPGVPSYPVNQNSVKIPAGWLIEKAGWKGKKVGNVGTYENQALVIVNFGNADGDEIFAHAQRIQQSVKQMFGIELAPEVNIIE